MVAKLPNMVAKLIRVGEIKTFPGYLFILWLLVIIQLMFLRTLAADIHDLKHVHE
jgi:hypothetical protein